MQLYIKSSMAPGGNSSTILQTDMSHWTIAQAKVLDIDCDYTMVWFPASLFKTRRQDDGVYTIHLHQETFCNNEEMRHG